MINYFNFDMLGFSYFDFAAIGGVDGVSFVGEVDAGSHFCFFEHLLILLYKTYKIIGMSMGVVWRC